MHTCLRPRVLQQEKFQTGAKCAHGKVVVGGHHLQTGQWFSLTLFEHQVPFFVKENGYHGPHSTAAKLLAVTLAMILLFGYLEKSASSQVLPLVLYAGPCESTPFEKKVDYQVAPLYHFHAIH